MQRIETTEKKIMLAIVSVMIIAVFVQAVILFLMNQFLPFGEIQAEENSEAALHAITARGDFYSLRYGIITLCGNLCFVGAVFLGAYLIKTKASFRFRTIIVLFMVTMAGLAVATAPFAILDSQWRSEYYKPIYIMGVYAASIFLVLLLMNFISGRRRQKLGE